MSMTDLQRALQHGFIDRHAQAPARLSPALINNQSASTMSRAISTELRDADSFLFSVAFITAAAVSVLKQDLLDFAGTGVIVTSNYLGFNTPQAYRELLNIPGLKVMVMPDSSGFHAKGYVFNRAGDTTAIVGSSNLTVDALANNHEWNLRFSASNDGHLISQFEAAIRLQLAQATLIDDAWVDDFERTYVPVRFQRASSPLPITQAPAPSRTIVPNRMQMSALSALSSLRDEGERRALVVSATGTGKTILSALDVRAYGPGKFLFLAHREQILDKAMEEFQLVLNEPASRFGKLSGSSRDLGHGKRYLFATTFSFVRAIRNGLMDEHEFDYVLVDEVHRAGAATYLEILDFLKPDFLLGMTATPERTDDFNVFELFHYNLAYEIRLQAALEENMLAPFHYFGVTDFTTASGETISETSELRHLVSEERADHLVKVLTQYGQAGQQPRGLIFCSRNREAERLAELLNERELHGRKLRTLALSGADSIEKREWAVSQLEAGDLDYLLSVDVFNEGIDIPSLNQVVMLRQTQSSIVFTQQLGRGLRKYPDKDYVVVIDFIGNYANNYLIPTALFGDTSLNRDQLRRRIIDTDNDHIIAGVSSINFDRIAKERVFASIAQARLDSLMNLRSAFRSLRDRIGRTPMLLDFAKHDVLDPEVIAGKYDHYADFIRRATDTEIPALAEDASRVLTLLTREFLNGKRPQELLLLNELICKPGALPMSDFQALLREHDLDCSARVLESVRRILALEWFTDAERRKYGNDPIVEFDGICFHLGKRWQAAWTDQQVFAPYALDAINTGLYLSRHRYNHADTLIVGERYTRKDVCRLLNWQRNEQATMYGYKVDRDTNTCPIFVTYHKADDVSESTRYEDEFIDEQTMLWYTRSRRTLRSREVRAIVEEGVPLYLFVKKDDVEGTDFIYLGSPTPSNAEQTTMPGGDGQPLQVVTMHLELEQAVDRATFDYLVS